MTTLARDGLILDFDGVIVDSYTAVTGSMNAALAEHGYPQRPAETLRHFIGPPTFTSFAELTGEPATSPAVAAVVATYRRHYASVYLQESAAIPGMAELLETLSGRLQLAIATSKSETFTRPLLAALGLERRFAVVEAARANDTSDDKTAIVGRALAALRERGARAIAMVGDRSFDMEAARAQGLEAIGVTWGIGSAAELRGAGADHLVDTPAQLAALVGGRRTGGRSGGR